MHQPTIEVRIRRFWVRTDVDENGCWIWRGKKNRRGYGVVQWDGKWFLAHRIAYQWVKGEIATGLLVCHSCDVPSCVNPSHLWLGTDADNQADSIAKGRADLARTAHRVWTPPRLTMCGNGLHPMSGDNLIVRVEAGRERRRCRACVNAKNREYDHRQRHVA